MSAVISRDHDGYLLAVHNDRNLSAVYLTEEQGELVATELSRLARETSTAVSPAKARLMRYASGMATAAK